MNLDPVNLGSITVQDFDFAPVTNAIVAYGVLLARPVAMLTFTPVFSRVQYTALLRGVIASALVVPMVPSVSTALQHQGWSALGLTVLIAKETLIGFALGLVLGAPFWALDIAGDYLDAQRGATQGRLNDPAGFSDVSITGTLLVMAAVALFVVTGGLETLTDLLYRSWAIWKPLGAFPQLDARTPDLVLGFLDRITRQGLMLALPLIVVMLLAEAGLLIVARFAPQLRIDDLALSVRNIVFLSFLPIYAVFLIGYVRQDFGTLPGLVDLLRDAAPEGAAR
jgi:type III secretion protein T